MRKLFPFLLLLLTLLLVSCSSMAKIGEAVCGAQQDISATVTDALGWAGAPGRLIANITNTVLKVGCKLFDVIASAPQDAAIDLGLSNANEPAVLHPPDPPER